MDKEFDINEFLNTNEIINAENKYNKEKGDILINKLNEELNKTVIENSKELENNLTNHMKISQIIFENKKILLENKENLEIENLNNYLKNKENEIQKQYEEIIKTKNNLISYLIEDKIHLYENFINLLINKFEIIKEEDIIIVDELIEITELYFKSNEIMENYLKKNLEENHYNKIFDILGNIKKNLIIKLQYIIDNLEIENNEFLSYELNQIFICYNNLDLEIILEKNFKKLININFSFLNIIENNLNQEYVIYYFLKYNFENIGNKIKNIVNYDNNEILKLESNFYKFIKIYDKNFSDNIINSIIENNFKELNNIKNKKYKTELISKIKKFETKLLLIENNIEDIKIIEIFKNKFNYSIEDYFILIIDDVFKINEDLKSLEKNLLKIGCKFVYRINNILNKLLNIMDVEGIRNNLRNKIKINLKKLNLKEKLENKIINIIN